MTQAAVQWRPAAGTNSDAACGRPLPLHVHDVVRVVWLQRPGDTRPLPSSQLHEITGSSLPPLVCVPAGDRAFSAALDGGSESERSVQPRDAGTGAAVVVATVRIARVHPDATVVLLPSDQFVADDPAMLSRLRDGVSWVDSHPRHVVVLGVPATHAHGHHDWLLPECPPLAVRPVPATLFAQPSAALAESFLELGSFWSTMITVFRARTMLAHVEVLAPQWSRAAVTTAWTVESDLAEAYATLPPLDFSRDILGRVPSYLDVLPVQSGPGSLRRNRDAEWRAFVFGGAEFALE